MPKGKQRSVGTSILLAIVTFGIYTFFWTYYTHKEIKDYSGIGVGGPLGLLIYFFVSPVTWFLVPNDISQLRPRYGQQSNVSAITGLWILLPIIGPFVWFPKVQGELNEFWATAP
jgi:hypothetical protein